jgi:hypothetical protein
VANLTVDIDNDNESGSVISLAKTSSWLGIYYQNVRDFRTKQLEFYYNVVASEFDIICLTETWLNDLYHRHNLFPEGHIVYRSDRVSTCKTHGGGGALIAFLAS